MQPNSPNPTWHSHIYNYIYNIFIGFVFQFPRGCKHHGNSTSHAWNPIPRCLESPGQAPKNPCHGQLPRQECHGCWGVAGQDGSGWRYWWHMAQNGTDMTWLLELSFPGFLPLNTAPVLHLIWEYRGQTWLLQRRIQPCRKQSHELFKKKLLTHGAQLERLKFHFF